MTENTSGGRRAIGMLLKETQEESMGGLDAPLTRSSLNELIEFKFFQFETRMREHLMVLMGPYVKK
jgi:hypothetical protein